VNLSYVFNVDVDEPHSFGEALNVEESQHWKKAMDSKFQSLQNNNNWIFNPLPFDHKLVKCKWIIQIKYNANDFMAMHKARLVAKGFIQVEGIDFNETFPLIAWMESIWIVFAIVAIANLKMCQMDVKIAFLNGDLLVQICICNNHKALWSK
jgi:hypothetical protein